MKKIIQILFAGILLLSISCKEDSDKDEVNPLAFLAFLGNSSLTVTATYSGSEITGIDPADGTGKIFVYLYRNLGTDTRDPEPAYKGSTENAVTLDTPANVTINNIIAGSYYVLVFYDYAGGGKNDDNFNDRYVLYQGTAYTSGASKFTISGDTNLDIGTFGDDNILGDGSVFMSTATYNLTVPVTYTGTLGEASATRLMYVYLYNTLGTSTRNPALPVKTGVSSAVAASGVQQNITVADVVPGNYYVLVFYDSVKGANIDSEGDPYVFFVNTPYAGNAQQIVMPAADTTLPDVSFGASNTLQADGAYQAAPSTLSTLTVTAQYTGTIADDGTGKIFVYLYSVLGNGTRDKYFPIYTGSTAAAVALSTDTDIVIDNIIPGSYYMVLFYDFKLQSSNDDGKNDRYELYDNCSLVSEADTFLIDEVAETLTGVVITNTSRLGADNLLPGNYFIQP